MYDIWAWESDVGDESQVIARASDINVNRMVAGGQLKWADRYQGAYVAGPPSSESRHTTLVMLGVMIP